MTRTRALWTAAVTAMCAAALPAAAWDRGRATVFAVLPEGSGGPEGLEVDPDGHVYVGSFGFAAKAPLTGEGRIFVYGRDGRLLRELKVAGSSAHLLGLHWREATRRLLVVDFGAATVLEVDPLNGSSTVFMTVPAPPQGASVGLNDVTTDRAGNVYVSDSFQGIVWRVGPQGGVGEKWVESALLRTSGVPPFGANGLRLDRGETAMFVANTGNDTVVKIPVSGGTAGTPAVFVNSINGADGLLVDDDGNVWVAANQEDEIVVVDPTGRAIAKLGDFDGVRRGVPRGLLFPASIRFLGRELLVTNLALDLRLFDETFVAVDSPWTAIVEQYTVSRLPARLERGRAATGSAHDDGP